jgi:hypothetical protein
LGCKLSTANLEMGRPTVEAALKHLSFEIRHARSTGCTVLKLIHGYGSSGTGGKIRIATRKKLTDMAGKGQIKAVIPGEDFSIFNENTRQAFLVCGDLRKDSDLERRNQGITLVLL